MQLKRLSAQLFLDVQMEVQKVVLQAQRTGLEMADEYGIEHNERANNGATLPSNARMTNGYDDQLSVQNHSMDERNVSRKGGDDEVEWEECQIKVSQSFEQFVFLFLIVKYFLHAERATR